jgi:hypothetical protein
MKRQDPTSVYRYHVHRGDQVTVRIQAVRTGHMVVVVLDEIEDPPPPATVKVDDWVEYRFAVTKSAGNHLLGCRYDFSEDAAADAFYRHQVLINGNGQPCLYKNIPDLRKGDPLPENQFRFELSAGALEC